MKSRKASMSVKRKVHNEYVLPVMVYGSETWALKKAHMELLSVTSVVTIPDFAMRYVSRYLGHDAIRIAILVYRVSQSLDLQFVYDGSAIYRPRYTLLNHHNRCRMCWSLAVA